MRGWAATQRSEGSSRRIASYYLVSIVLMAWYQGRASAFSSCAPFRKFAPSLLQQVNAHSNAVAPRAGFCTMMLGRIAPASLRAGMHTRFQPDAAERMRFLCRGIAQGRWGSVGMRYMAKTDSPQNEDELLQGLNAAQRTAVKAPPGPMIVLAGPGSGKTRVLTSRIAFLIKNGAAPTSIVAVTFTNKASNEMRQRIKNVLGIKHDSELQVTVGTFHKICLNILREYGYLMGLAPNFLIFDADQQRELVTHAMQELGYSTETMQPNTIRSAISNLKSQNLAPENAGEFHQRNGAVWNPKFVNTVMRVYQVYQEELRRSNAVDFDDILLFTLRLLQQHSAVTAQLQDRWQHLLVDEWQDTNVPQYSLIRLLAAPSGGRDTASVFVVGDADQSIYGWRGADFTNVAKFESEFAAERILLEHNYRSTSTIVEAAQCVIERNGGRVDKKMISNKPCGALVNLHQVWDDQEEASFVARHARHLVESGAVAAGYREIAVMYRTNQQSRVMEEQFVRNGVPYQLIGATKFYERKEVKDLLAYLRVLANPDDSVSLLRIINVPPRRIGKATVERLLGLSAMWGCSVFQALARLNQDVTSSTTTTQTTPAAAAAPSEEFSVDALDLDNLDEAMATFSTALNMLPETPRAHEEGEEVVVGPAERAALQAGLKAKVCSEFT